MLRAPKRLPTFWRPSFSPYPYSPECVEGEFRELRTEEVLRSSPLSSSPEFAARVSKITHLREALEHALCLSLLQRRDGPASRDKGKL